MTFSPSRNYSTKLVALIALTVGSAALTGCASYTTEPDTEQNQALEQAQQEQPSPIEPTAQGSDETAQHPRQSRDQLQRVPSDMAEEHQNLRDQLTQMARESRAQSVDACVIAPFGHNPCGGPASHLIYSNEGKSSEELEQIEADIARFNELDQLVNAANEIVGACRYIEPPRVTLIEDRCVPEHGRRPGRH